MDGRATPGHRTAPPRCAGPSGTAAEPDSRPIPSVAHVRVPAQAVPAIEVPRSARPSPPVDRAAGSVRARRSASKLPLLRLPARRPANRSPLLRRQGSRRPLLPTTSPAARSGRSSGTRTRTPSRFPVLDRIRDAESDGREVRIDILRHGLSPREALLVEAAVRDALGHRGTVEALEPAPRRRRDGRGAGQARQVQALPSGRAVAGGRPRCRCLLRDRSPQLADRSSLDRPGSPRSPRWAVIVVGELVAAVFRIDRWEPAGSGGGATAGRCATPFAGVRDPELESRYLGRTRRRPTGAGSPEPGDLRVVRPPLGQHVRLTRTRDRGPPADRRRRGGRPRRSGSLTVHGSPDDPTTRGAGRAP